MDVWNRTRNYYILRITHEDEYTTLRKGGTRGVFEKLIVLVGVPSNGPDLIDEEQFLKVMIWLLVKRIPTHIIPDIRNILKPIRVYQDAKKPYGRDKFEKTLEVKLTINVTKSLKFGIEAYETRTLSQWLECAYALN